jgi:hypothetical protein
VAEGAAPGVGVERTVEVTIDIGCEIVAVHGRTRLDGG